MSPVDIALVVFLIIVAVGGVGGFIYANFFKKD